MGNRLTKIYTRTGDDGSTSLGDGSRASKDSPRIAAYGELDELNSCLGILLAEAVPDSVSTCLNEVQQTLFDLGGDLCIPGRSSVNSAQVDWLERWLDHFNDTLPPLKDFILPGGNRAAGACHLARTVCRRAERAITTLSRHENVDPAAGAYINRLSDLLFVVARIVARENQGQEVLWQPGRDEAPEPR